MLENKENSSSNIIMIDYYDGVTEGVIRKFKDGNSYYFKLIAWDDFQDERLFALKSVDNDAFSQIDMNNSRNISQKELIDLYREKLINSELLALGNKIDSDLLAIFDADKTIKTKVAEALNKDSVDDLNCEIHRHRFN